MRITKGSTEVSTKASDITSQQLPALLTALKAAKEDSNAVLSKLVEDSKDLAKQTTAEDEDDEESSEDDSKKRKC